jgi:sugar phosphate isomerase/epimerase
MAAPRKKIPLGLEMYTLKAEEQKDRLATLRAVAKMGYEGVEFWGPYVEWTAAYAKEVRKQLDDLGLTCFSTHTRPSHWSDERFPNVIELNQILGSDYVVMDHAPESPTLDGWKRNAEVLTKGYERLKPVGIKAALHNWTTEWRLCEGVRPIDYLVRNTPPGFGFQLDLGTAFGERGDPIAFIKANPGRVRSYHLKDWSADRSRRGLLIGEGDVQWTELFKAAETTGGVEYYLIEQEGSRFTPLETAERSLKNYRQLRARGRLG